ncbi:MAG: hypothetical protein RL299_182 [Pseudomonadota bacterium]|jgi:peptidylprolyl isomerase
MHKTLIALAALTAASPALPQASAAIASGKAQPSPLAPSEIVAQAPKADWTGIAASDLLVMDLAPDAKGKPRRVVIQLMPAPFSQGWIGNIRKLAAARFWDGTAINRVQDNYVVQWGDPDAEDKAKAKALPAGLVTVPESGYSVHYMLLGAVASGEVSPTQAKIEVVNIKIADMEQDLASSGIKRRVSGPTSDKYAAYNGFERGWPVASDHDLVWPVHCYGMVGVGRDLSPNTGSGAELYVVIGHAPRHLDRNIALVGRVVEGIEHLSSLPRGHGALGFYDLAQGDERTGIVSIRQGDEVKDLPAYEYLSTESGSFSAYADARANRRDAFFIRPAGGADICNIPVPVRRVK